MRRHPSVDKIRAERERLIRLIAARKKSRRGYRDLEVRLVAATTDQILAELRQRPPQRAQKE